MSKPIIAAVVIVAVAALAIYKVTRPEPTPQERLAEAAEKASEATQEAVGAVSDAAQDVGEALTSSASDLAEEMKSKVSDSLADMAEQVAQTTEDTQAQMRQFIDEWEASGIVNDDGIDFTKATAEIEASDMSVGAKANVIAVLTSLQEASGAFEEKLDALKTLLNT